MNIAVHFEWNTGAPTRKLADAEIHFLDGCGPFDGLKLVGFAVWQDANGGMYVTQPSRAFGTSTERRYFDFVRSIAGQHADTQRLKDFVREAFKQARDARQGA